MPAVSYCARLPVPKSPSTANFSESGRVRQRQGHAALAEGGGASDRTSTEPAGVVAAPHAPAMKMA